MNMTNTANSSFFEPDVLTADRYLRVYRHKGRFNPEERLMFAVLTDAIECFQKYFRCDNPRLRRLSIEAELWFGSRRSDWPYSFEHICEGIGINAEYLRVGLTRWRVTQDHIGGPRGIRGSFRYQHRVNNNRVDMQA